METIVQKIGNIDSNNLFIKRDDYIPFSFGGNKARKLKYFYSDYIKGNYDCFVTYGSSSSNHCRVVSNLAKSINVECHIISPLEESKTTMNSELMKMFGAEITIVPVSEVKCTIDNIISELRRKGKNPYFIPGGGHGNLGTQAYVDCYEEIRNYEKENDIFFDYIFFASGTGTTQAGLICGQLINNDNHKIIGISVARKNPCGRDVVLKSIKEYLLSRNIKFNDNNIEANTIFLDDYVGDGYSSVNEELSILIESVMCKYGLPLDPTYTGKAFYGMEKYIKENNINNKNILFIHTGGTPLAFDFFNK